MKRLVMVVLLACAGGAPFQALAEGGVAVDRPVDPVIQQYNDASAAKNWTQAVNVLGKAVQSNPRNAEYHNLYAYSLRHTANPDMGLVFKHYGEAIRLDPRHKGAREYLGEAYLQVGDVAKAKEQLAELERMCFIGCGERDDLRKSIAAYEAKQKR
jgi:cytochrome c-type biogenesis protein CcmH/NrfG